MKSVTVSGKTIEQAIEEGLALLNTTFENVDIKVISEGGFLKKASVELTLSEEEPKPAKKETKTTDKEVKKTAKKEVKKAEKESKKVEKTEKKKEEKPQDLGKDAKLETEIAEMEQELKTITNENKENEENVVKQTITDFLTGLLNAYSIIAKVDIVYEDKYYRVNIVGENLGVLIGYHGEALNAIQYLLATYVYNKLEKHVKLSVDIEGYRQKRAEKLTEMVDGLVDRVLEQKRSYKLEPMSSYERKVIHSHLQNKQHIETHSEGTEPKRYLVIDYVA